MLDGKLRVVYRKLRKLTAICGTKMDIYAGHAGSVSEKEIVIWLPSISEDASIDIRSWTFGAPGKFILKFVPCWFPSGNSTQMAEALVEKLGFKIQSKHGNGFKEEWLIIPR